jgi:hypothetical protein
MTRISGISTEKLLELHQFQYDGSHRNPNECGLCSMAMLLEMGARKSGADVHINALEFGLEIDRIPFRFPRFPAWFPGPGGATHPFAALWGMQRKIGKLRREGNDMPWRAVLRFRQTEQQLETEIAQGNPTLIYGVGRTGIPHVVVPIGRDGNKWQILDPAFARERNPRQWSQPVLMDWWKNFGLLYPRGTMISLKPQVQ